SIPHTSLSSPLFLFACSVAHPALHSFPTRRSSDLCRSGNRTKMNTSTLAACAGGECYVLEGGLDAWIRAGLPIAKDASQPLELQDRKSTRLNSSHVKISYAVFCLKKKTPKTAQKMN